MEKYDWDEYIAYYVNNNFWIQSIEIDNYQINMDTDPPEPEILYHKWQKIATEVAWKTPKEAVEKTILFVTKQNPSPQQTEVLERLNNLLNNINEDEKN